jgi:hypothetical protein
MIWYGGGEGKKKVENKDCRKRGDFGILRACQLFLSPPIVRKIQDTGLYLKSKHNL